MNFQRAQSISENISPRRALIIYGPRRVGKTTLLHEYLTATTSNHPDSRILSVVGDNITVQNVFASRELEKLKHFAQDYDIIAIDEAQQVPHIGIGTKMLVDHFPEKTFILTGSSSFELAGQIGEPLTGRHFTLTLLPIAQSELQIGNFERTEALAHFLIYGAYPEVLTTNSPHGKQKILTELVSSYLYRDVLALDRIKSPTLLRNITKILATQIGHDVSLNEIANTLDADVKTVGRYIDLLEKMFVIKKVPGFSRNLRTEITKKARYYFLDNGVRNAVLGQFSTLDMRTDHGALWENFIFMELLKRDVIEQKFSTYYFWRTHTGAEVDIIREENGQLRAFECKWNPRKARRTPPQSFASAYPNTPFATITPENYLSHICP